MPSPLTQSDEPFCSACGYSLKGCTESSKCPECGRPLVEVLQRASFPGRKGYRYRSARLIGGLPLVSIAMGPSGAERVGRPVGIIAIGDLPLGVIAIGGMARGVVAIGGLALGVVGFGGWAVGLLAIGGGSVGIVAVGGVAVGGWAIGGTALYIVRGWGGFAQRILGW